MAESHKGKSLQVWNLRKVLILGYEHSWEGLRRKVDVVKGDSPPVAWPGVTPPSLEAAEQRGGRGHSDI